MLACLSFVLGLSDTRLRRIELPAAPAAPAVSSAEPRSVLVLSVVDEAGAAIDGATAQVFWERNASYHLMAAGVSDANGAARFEELPSGRFWVLAEAPGFGRSSTSLVLDAPERHAELVLPRAHALRVRVTNEDQEPIERATVLVTTGDPLPFGALTKADGVASLERLGKPPWSVKISAPGYESSSRAGVNGDFEVSLRRLGSITVRVERPDGSPAAGATVSIGGPTLWPARTAETDSNGTTRIAGLLPGSYDLRARSGALVSDVLSGFELARGAHETVTLRLAPGRMVTALVTDGEGDSPVVVPNADVVLAEGGISAFPLQGRTGSDGKVTLGPIGAGPATLAARAADFVASSPVAVPQVTTEPVRIALVRGGRLKGRVSDARGFPVDGASIEVVGTDLGGLPIAETPELVNFRRSHFAWALPGPPPLIPAGELGVMPGPVPPIPRPGESPQTPLGPAVDAGADLLLAPWVTRSDGTFEAHPVTPGRVRAIVRHPDYVDGLSEVVTLAPGGEAEVEIVLLRGGTLEGRVVDDRGRPVEGAEIEITAQRGTFQRSAITAGDGTFAFAALPAEVTISVSRPEEPARVVLRRQLEVPEGAREQVELTLPAPREALRIAVTDDADQPIELAEVSVHSLDPDAPLRLTQFTDELGEVTIEDARGLRLRVLVEAPGYARAARVLESAPELVTLRLEQGVLVEGRVTAVRGRQNVENAVVTLVSDGVRKTANTDADGMYRFRDVTPGAARITVSHPEFAEGELALTVSSTGRSDRPFEVPAIDLEEPAEIEGEVLDERGEPVAGARVAVGAVPAYLPAGSLPRGVAVTDSRGQFTLRGIRPGVLTLEATSVAHGRGSARGVQAIAGRTTRDVEIRLSGMAAGDESFSSGGVAVTLGERGSGEALDVVVVSVAEASEAERGGLLPGDVVIGIDGVTPTSMADARNRLSGPLGSDVVVDVERGGTEVGLRIRRESVRR